MIGISAAVMRGVKRKRGYRHYRLWVTATSFGTGGAVLGLAELSLVSPSNLVGVPIGGAPSASSSGRNYPPVNAFDGNTGTDWRAGSRQVPVHLAYDFGEGNEQRITAYRLLRASGGNTTVTIPADWEFQASDDGVNWEVLDAQTGQSDGWPAGQYKEYLLQG